MKKIINAEGQKFVPVTTDDLVLDAVPTVNSFNSVTSDAVARAVAGASGEVPQVTEGDNGKILTAIYDAGGPAVEWGEAPSSTVSTSGVISGDGSAADPVVLNVGAGLSSVTSGGTTTFTVTDIAGGYFRLTRDQALAILQSQSPVTVNFTGNGSWKCNSAGSEYIFGLNCSRNRTVFFNPLRQGNDATYPQPWEGDISAVNYVLDPSNVDTTHGISVQDMVTALEADPTIEYVYLNYYMPQYGYWTTCPDSLSGYSAVFTVPSASGATTSLVVANPVPAYAAGDVGKVLTVNSGATGVEWASATGGGYTPVDLQTITAAPYNIPVGNRQDVAVTLTGYTTSDILTIQLASDCTDAVVKVNATPAGFDGIRVMRGSDTVALFGLDAIYDVRTLVFEDSERVLLTTNATGDSGYEVPTSFSEVDLSQEAHLISDVDITTVRSSDARAFLIEIKGRNAIIHAL